MVFARAGLGCGSEGVKSRKPTTEGKHYADQALMLASPKGILYEKASKENRNPGSPWGHEPEQKERASEHTDLPDLHLRSHRHGGAGSRHAHRPLLHPLRQSHAHRG